MSAATPNPHGGLCLHHLFESQVVRTPSAVAVVDGMRRVSYAELNTRANRLAYYLRGHGVGAETPVAICMDRSIGLLVGLLSVLKAGGAYVPIEPAYPQQRVDLILNQVRPRVVLTETHLRDKLPPVDSEIVCVDELEASLERESGENPDAQVTPGNLSYVLFTSGSTGQPKGVALEHRGAVRLMQWAREVYSDQELAGTLFSTSVCFDLSVFEIFAPLSVGGKVILAENALSLRKLPAADEITLINTVPSAFAELLRMMAVPSRVQVANLAGEALGAGLVEQIHANTKIKKIYNLYGPTEDTTYSTWSLVPWNGEVTIGRPVSGSEVYVLDSNLQKVKVGVAGEICLSGAKLARGYFGRPDLTSERFVANPFVSVPGSRMYRTGDIGRMLPDGNLQYLGRLDEQVKVRGYRIEPGEVECAILRSPSVGSAVVAVREDHGDQLLVAYVVSRNDRPVDTGDLRRQLQETLPGYMIPDTFVVLDALPLTANGKVDRQRLSLLRPTCVEAEGVIRLDNLEGKILDAWKKALGTEAVRLNDNFFDLGGNSIRAARVITELEKNLAREIPLSAFFLNATIRAQAEFLRKAEVEASVLTRLQSGDGGLPLIAVVSPGEESLGYALLAHHMGVEQTVYKLQAGAPILGDRPFTQSELIDLSREYMDALLSVQREGPYCFCAMCDGVQIAERLVIDLEKEGFEIGFLAIFDTWVLQHSQVPWLWQMHYYQQRLGELGASGLLKKLRGTPSSLQRKTSGLAKGQFPVRSDWREAYWPANFEPQKFQAPVILFKRPKQPFYYVNDPEMGWGTRSLGGVRAYELDFDHRAMLREPYVVNIAEVLTTQLRKLDPLAKLTVSQ